MEEVATLEVVRTWARRTVPLRQAMEGHRDSGTREQLLLVQDSTLALSVFGRIRFLRGLFPHARSPFLDFLYSLAPHSSLAERSIPFGGRPAVLSWDPGAAFRRSTAMAVMALAIALTLGTIGPPMAQVAKARPRTIRILRTFMAEGLAT
jgi:hypothetical protein